MEVTLSTLYGFTKRKAIPSGRISVYDEIALCARLGLAQRAILRCMKLGSVSYTHLLADALCAAGDHRNFVFKHGVPSSIRVFVQSLHQKAHRTKTVVA